MLDLSEQSHRRFNPLTAEWVQVSTHQARRHCEGQLEKAFLPKLPSYDLACYRCPGNERSTGEPNPNYEYTYSFINDFSALTDQISEGSINENDLIVAKS